MNSNINSSGLYDVNSYNLITTNATVLSTLNVAGNIIGSGTALSNLNYGSITNPPDLTQYNAWTKSGNNVYNTLLSNGNVGIGNTNPTGILEIKNSYLTPVKFKIGHYGRWAANQIFCDGFFRFLTSHTLSNEVAYFGYVDNYDDPINRTMVLQINQV